MDRLHRSDVTCSFVQVGQIAAGPLDPVRDLALARSWGHVADTELLLHIAECTGGSVRFAADLEAASPLPAASSDVYSTVSSSTAATRLGTAAQLAFLFPATPCCGGPSAASEGLSESMFVANEVGSRACHQHHSGAAR